MKRNASKCCRCISMVSCVVADDNFRSLMQLIAALHRQYLIPIFPFFAFVRPFNQPAIFPCRSCIHLRPTHIEFVDSLNAYADVCMCVCVCVWHIFKRSLHPLFSIKHTIDLISGHLNAFYRTEIDIDIEDESGEMCIRSALTRFFPPTFHVKNEMMARLVVVCFTSKSNIAMAGWMGTSKPSNINIQSNCPRQWMCQTTKKCNVSMFLFVNCIPWAEREWHLHPHIRLIEHADVSKSASRWRGRSTTLSLFFLAKLGKDDIHYVTRRATCSAFSTQ